MRHYPTDNGGHWAVAPEADNLGVLVQVMEGNAMVQRLGHMSRELLTTDEARAMAGALLDTAMAVENRNKQLTCNKPIPERGPAQCSDGHWLGSKQHPLTTAATKP